MSTLEQRLLEFWTADAAIWRRMTATPYGAALGDDQILAGGRESSLYETWEERKARRAIEREANIKAEKEKLKLVKYDCVECGKLRAELHRKTARKRKAA